MGIIKAVNIFEDIFKPTTLRNGHYFCQVKGIDREQGYNDFLALAAEKSKVKSEQVLLQELPLPSPNDRLLIDSILDQLPTMPLGHYADEDLSLTSSLPLNKALREAFDLVLPFAVVQEKFASDSIKDNFIVKLMIWSNQYSKDWVLSRSEIPKVIFYGEIKKHEGYFLLLLAIAGFDVLYLNPLGNQVLETIDREKLCQTVTLTRQNHVVKLAERVAKGVAIETVTTSAKRATDELEEILYTGSGIFRPWQFANGSTKAVLINAVYEDIITYWDEQARIRTGFKVVGNIVYTPVFFTKILGVQRDLEAYFALIRQLRSCRHNYFSETTQLAKEADNQQAVYSLAFCLNPDKTINRAALAKHLLYQRFLTFRSDLQKFILDKIDEVFAPSNQNYFLFPISDKERVQLMAALFTADDQLINLIDGYDFTGDIPKIIFYLNGRDTFERDDALLLGLFYTMGLDVVILSPNGANNIELVIAPPFINVIRLDEFAQNLALPEPRVEQKRKSFLQRMFGDNE